MKKIFVLSAALAASCILVCACATFKSGKTADFGTVESKVWQLDQVVDASGKTTYSHAAQDKEKFNDVYTIQFSLGRAAGKASPNRYNGPYTLGEDNTIAFKHFASTMMANFHTPEGLGEHQYFKLLEKVSTWNIKKNQLVLTTVDDSGAKVTMTFKEFDYR